VIIGVRTYVAQDFAKNKAASSKKSASSGTPGWIWLIAGIITGAFIMFLVYLNSVAPQKATSKKAEALLPPVEEHSEKPTFEFYDRLMNTETIDDKKHPTTLSSTASTAATTYILQAAAFQKEPDADALKAKLILEGLDTSIQKFDNKGQTFYRVLVGPVTNQDKLAQAKTVLAQHNLNPIVLQQAKK